MTNPDQTDRQDGQIRPHLPDAGPLGRPRRWSPGVSASVRLLLLGLSMGGMLAVIGAWTDGHPGLAFRILAGDIVVIVALLLLL